MRRVVVTGVGVATSIGAGCLEFLKGLQSAQSGIGPISSFDASTFSTQIAGEIKKPLEIDLSLVPPPLQLGIRRDRKAGFGLYAANEALSQAFGGGEPSDHYRPEQMGVMLASGLEVFHLGELTPHLDGRRVDETKLGAAVEAAPTFGTLQIPSHLLARALAGQLKAQGPFSVNVSACAAGTQSIGEAFIAIRDGACDFALTGGFDSMVNPLGVGGFTLLGALSTSNERGATASRPFDRSRDGFVLGEGAGVVVLESHAGARARGAEILGEVLGYGSSLDAFKVSAPLPDGAAAARAMKRAMKMARLGEDGVHYINAHGTGTPKNDPVETLAIRRALGARASKIPVSSTKSQIGHLIGAAGAVEFIASLLALREGFLPATLHLEDPDPRCDLSHVPMTPRDARGARTFLSNSFGFGGQNASLVASCVVPSQAI